MPVVRCPVCLERESISVSSWLCRACYDSQARRAGDSVQEIMRWAANRARRFERRRAREKGTMQ